MSAAWAKKSAAGLKASFDAEKAAATPKTRELLDAIASFAEETATTMVTGGGCLRLRSVKGVCEPVAGARPAEGRAGPTPKS